MDVILFEDDQVRELYPLTLGRPAFAISCGSYRLLDLAEQLGQVRSLVRPHLRPLEPDRSAAEFPEPTTGPTLWLNGRLVPSFQLLDVLNKMAGSGLPWIVHTGKCVAAALVPSGKLSALSEASTDEALPWSGHLDRLALAEVHVDLPLLEYPHDVVRQHLRVLGPNLERRLQQGEYSEIADGVFTAAGVHVGEHLVTRTADGPIVLDAGASVGPFCYLSGPAYIGPRAKVIEHASLKDGTSLGHTTKVGGEVEASIIEPYSNKQHHGFLGHSYLGSWVNLGAGTCTSDLKNTYGQVNMQYDGRKVPTGMQFVGCFIGDYAKTAINTGIFTGKTVGACSMLYGFVTTNVPSFVNYARSFGQVTETPVGVMISTQARMFARRTVEQRPCDIQLLRDMHELTRHERAQLGPLPSEPLSL